MNLCRKFTSTSSTLCTVNKFYLFMKPSSMESTSSSAKSRTWRGVPMTEILGAQSPWTTPEFPMVSPSYNHSVLYHVPSNSSISMDTPPKPQIGQEKWDHDFVRMPFSSKSLYPVIDQNGETQLKKRWPMIQEALKKPIHNSVDLAEAILSYNSRNKWTFRSLHRLFADHIDDEESQMFFDVTLPEIIKLALDLPKLIQSPIPLLRRHKNQSISLSQQQIASLLANAFLCTFPRRNSNRRVSKEYYDYPHINFSSLFEASPIDSVLEKLKCICNYFRRVCTQVPAGALTFTRRHAPTRRPRWPTSGRPLAAVPIHVDSSTAIEDAHGLIQFDFANKFLGGGVLGHGCVQEEIRFVICPELMISMLFTEMLQPDEALIMIGCERYSNYTGYGDSFVFSGDHRDVTPRDSSGRRRCVVLAVDALPFRNQREEFKPDMIVRELDKAWVGVSFDTESEPSSLQYPGVATGNWGCGAFGGTPRLKALLQLMACACAARPMAYYTFGDEGLRDDIVEVYNVLTRHDVTVGQLYNYILRFTEPTDGKRVDLYTFLSQLLMEQAARSHLNTSTNGAEPMDISSEEKLITKSLEREFLNKSPDLFSQELVTVETAVDETKTVEVKAETVEPKVETVERKAETVDPTTSDQGAEKTGRKYSLLEKMQELDEENCKLNLNNSRNAVKRESPSADVSMDRADSPKHVKKKALKITDYFSKTSN